MTLPPWTIRCRICRSPIATSPIIGDVEINAIRDHLQAEHPRALGGDTHARAGTLLGHVEIERDAPPA